MTDGDDREPVHGEELWRRIHKNEYVNGRITTAAFRHCELSVDIARMRVHKHLTLNDGNPGVGVASFSSDVAYANGLDVRRDPIEDNEAHALVIGKKPRRIQEALRDASQFCSREEIEQPDE